MNWWFTVVGLCLTQVPFLWIKSLNPPKHNWFCYQCWPMAQAKLIDRPDRFLKFFNYYFLQPLRTQCDHFFNPLSLKGIETFETCFFRSVHNGLQEYWSDPAGVGVILRKMFWVSCCRPLKMSLQLLLLFEKDSSFDPVQNTCMAIAYSWGYIANTQGRI